MDGLRSVICERRSYVAEPHTHAHAYAQLIIPVNGALAVTVAAQSFLENGPEVIYIPPDARHSFYAQSSNQFLVFDIPPAFIPAVAIDRPTAQPMDERWQAIRNLLALEVGEGPQANQRLQDLFRYILRLLEPATGHPSLEYIAKNYHRPITLQQLAALEHYQLSYYCEWFQRKFGLSPMTYIRQLRLAKAQNLLAETDYNLLQIAQQVGYEHHATLTRQFQAVFGLLPSEYRKKNRIRAKKER